MVRKSSCGAADGPVVDRAPGCSRCAHGASSLNDPTVRYELVQAEHGAVDEVDPVPVVAARRRRSRPIACMQASGAAEAEVPQVHERLDRLELDRQAQRVAERAVGVREAAVQRRRARRPGAAVTTRPSPVRISISRTDSCGRPLRNERGLDAEAGDRAADGDRLELRDDQRHQPVRAGSRRPGPRTSSCPRRLAVRAAGSTLSTCPNAGHVEPRRRGAAAPGLPWPPLNRNRLDVRLARRTGRPPGSRRSRPAAGPPRPGARPVSPPAR